MPCASSQSIRRFTSPITSGPMPSPGRSSSLWVAMVRYLIQLVMAGHDEEHQHPRGVLKRHCAVGKTPLLGAICATAPDPATVPLAGVIPCTLLVVRRPTRIQRG